MEQIMNYIKPELAVLPVVLYFLGMALKNAQAVKDKNIPITLGAAGIVLAALWVISTSTITLYHTRNCRASTKEAKLLQHTPFSKTKCVPFSALSLYFLRAHSQNDHTALYRLKFPKQ